MKKRRKKTQRNRDNTESCAKEECTWLERNVPSSFLFVTGLSAIPTLLLHSDPLIKAAQALVFLCFCLFARKRLRPLVALVFVFATVLMNVLSPFGKVIGYVGRFPLTQGALWAGLDKALTVVGLMYLSRLSVRSDLRLPGRFGELLGMTLRYLDRLLETKVEWSLKHPIDGLDRLLGSVLDADVTLSARKRQQPSAIGGVVLFLFAGCNWFCAFIPVLGII